MRSVAGRHNAENMVRDAEISMDRRYRWWLTRQWDDGPWAHFLMLNPSTADWRTDDPTIRRVVGLSRRWGMGGLIVTNLFALRATSPAMLAAAPDPIGGPCDYHIVRAAGRSLFTVCAWGAHRAAVARGPEVADRLAADGVDLRVLRLTKGGMPGHPLYVPHGVIPERWIRGT